MGDSGFYEASDDALRVNCGGLARWQFTSTVFGGIDSNRPQIQYEAPSYTNPVLLPSNSDTDTGIGGHHAADQLSLIAGGVEGIRISEDTTIQVDINGRTTVQSGTFAAEGDARSIKEVVYASTNDATETTLLIAGSAAPVIPADTTWGFSALIAARSDEADGNLSGVWKIEGCLARDESSNTAIVGSVTVTSIADGHSAAWSVTAEADDTNEALAIKVTGEASTNIRWVAKVDISQVSFA